MIGPKCTGFIMVISVWGTIFLSILGGLYYNQSVGLFEDLPDEHDGFGEDTWDERRKVFIDMYNQNAYNCWVGAGVYAGIALLMSFRACCLIRG